MTSSNKIYQNRRTVLNMTSGFNEEKTGQIKNTFPFKILFVAKHSVS